MAEHAAAGGESVGYSCILFEIPKIANQTAVHQPNPQPLCTSR
jgi:hypothetical protein